MISIPIQGTILHAYMSVPKQRELTFDASCIHAFHSDDERLSHVLYFFCLSTNKACEWATILPIAFVFYWPIVEQAILYFGS